MSSEYSPLDKGNQLVPTDAEGFSEAEGCIDTPEASGGTAVFAVNGANVMTGLGTEGL